ncbi:MAG TPA: hypothetical protein VF665_05110 [Longimicrobium sp.]|uniref:DUF7005 family protein n=1 Tax=Longimicrobium sp. TaxID=2029185 RepID=UPI002ED8CBFE
MSADAEFRAAVLAAHGARGAEVGELLAYSENAFVPAEGDTEWPLADEPFVAAWDGYAARAAGEGAAAVLGEVLPQLRFPIQDGMAAEDGYRAATLRGLPESHPGGGVRFVDEAGIRLFVHPTAAGRIPVIVARARQDFVALLRALTRKNQPDAIPDSMGACIVGGYNNWDRVARLRAEWEAHNAPAGWAAHFRDAVVPRRELYQDRFILLSSGPYSAVDAASLGLDADEWRERSVALRLDHECAHYFTRRVWGSMRNSLHDELIADYQGIRAVEGRYRADWFLRFMGVESEDGYREGGRLQNYRGTPPLSDGAFTVLGRLVRSAAAGLEAMDALRPRGAVRPARETARVLSVLTAASLEELASAESAQGVRTALATPEAALA